MEAFMVEIASEHPSLLTLFFGIGVLRAIFKPLQLVVDNFVDSTPCEKDNEAWAAIKASKWFLVLAWLLDLTASIKIKQTHKES
jgi:hypothetical protein